MTALGNSIERHGWLKAVIVNDRTGRILDGHARVKHALATGAKAVPCIIVNVDEAQEKRILRDLDAIGEMREIDQVALVALLKSTEESDGSFGDVYSKDEVGNLLLAMSGEKRVPDPNAEWEGMPGFEQEDQSAAFQLIVNFRCEEDVAEFESRLQQEIPRGSRGSFKWSIWFPEAEVERTAHIGYVSDDAGDFLPE